MKIVIDKVHRKQDCELTREKNLQTYSGDQSQPFTTSRNIKK